MLLSYEVTSASRAKDYFATSVSPELISSRQDYYSEGQEGAGTFIGTLAERLGLVGKPVDKEIFDRLCDNLHPSEARPLTPRTNDFRRVCYDFTFSGPKSYAIAEAFASDTERQRLRQAFMAAVEETITQEMEPDMQSRQREGGADHDIRTGNLLVVLFPHATSRPENDGAVPDMHPHVHALVWNATQRPDGRIHAGQFGDLIRDKPYFRAAFYARLAGKLEGLGYAIDRRGGTDWEIAGVPQALIDQFSKRTGQIEAAAQRLGIEDAASKAELGAKIRARKQKELTMQELRAAWDAQLTGTDREALAAVYRHDAGPARQVTPSEAVEFAIAHIGEKLSVAPEREFKRVALLHGLGSLSPQQVAEELPRHGVITAELGGRRMATTQALLAEEDYLVAQAMNGRGSVAAAGVAPELSRELAGGKRLNDGQWQAVCGLLCSPNRVNLLEGPAGAGKSSLLAKYGEGLRLAGKPVTWLATTSDAVAVLAKDGFAAGTVARFLLDEKMQAVARGSRVVVDETSLLGHRDAVRLFQAAEQYDLKLVLVGDPMQHGAVARGALMRILTDYGGVTPFRLTEIIRQENPEYRAAARLLSQGKAIEGFDAIDKMGRVVEMADAADRCRHIAADYVQALADRKSVLVVSPTHGEAKQITAAIRDELRRAGKLGAEDHAFTRLVAVDASVAERGQASTYRNGPLVLQFHQNAKGFTKGDRLTVTGSEQVPLHHADKFSLYRPETILLAKDDRVRFTGNVKTLDGKHTLKNGMVRTVKEVTGAGHLRLDNGWLVAGDCGHLRHGVVETSFGAQGRTVQRVILGMAASAGAVNREQLYVSASRAKEWIRLYTDDKPAIRDAVARSSQKLAALDLRPKPDDTDFHASDGMRAHMEHKRRMAVVGWMRTARQPGSERHQVQQPAERQAHGYGR